jgi:hypothetical protein
MYLNEQAKEVVLAELDLDHTLEGLEAARESLREFVNPDGTPPDGMQLAEGFYHVAAALALLNEPEVAAAARRVTGARAIALPSAEVPIEEFELVDAMSGAPLCEAF